MRSSKRSGKLTVFAVTLGCPKNRVDTEFMLGDMLSSGYALLDEPDDADVVIVNTCGFLRSARQESVQTLLDVKSRMRPGARLVAAGCMVQSFASEISERVGNIDLMVGTSGFDGLAARLAGNHTPCLDFPTSANPRLVTTGSAAYLKVADGCDRRCSFCIIPLIKGRQRSRTVVDLVAEAVALASTGVRELVLTAQDLTRYGADLENGDSLVSLVRALGQVSGIEWVRLMYLFPDKVTDELLDAVAESPNCLPYFDIPVQHGDDSVLAGMRRETRAADILDIVERIQKRLPGAFLRTTLMTGFPGETDAAFENMLDVVRRAAFDMVGVFEFSPEPGAPASEMPDQVSPVVAARRSEVLQELLSRIAAEKRRELIGRCFESVAEYVDEDGRDEARADARPCARVVGRMWFQAPEVDGVTYIDGLSGDDDAACVVQVTGFEDADFFARKI